MFLTKIIIYDKFLKDDAYQNLELKIFFVLSFVIMFNGIDLNSKILKI